MQLISIFSRKTEMIPDLVSPKAYALVAQLDRALPSEGRGCGFDPRRVQGFALQSQLAVDSS